MHDQTLQSGEHKVALEVPFHHWAALREVLVEPTLVVMEGGLVLGAHSEGLPYPLQTLVWFQLQYLLRHIATSLTLESRKEVVNLPCLSPPSTPPFPHQFYQQVGNLLHEHDELCWLAVVL